MTAKVYYNEFDKHAAEWLRNLMFYDLIPYGDVDERSIEDVRPEDLRGYVQCHFFAGIGGWPLALRLAGWEDSRPVWTGSCPCQPFSAAGARRGTDDPRHLWPAFRWLVDQCRPQCVFGEQVASKAGRQWLAGVRTDLEALGYGVGAADLCAASVSAPHIRQRLWWVADSVVCGKKPFRGNATEASEEPSRETRKELSSFVSGKCGEHGGLADGDSSGPLQRQRHGESQEPGQQASQRHDADGRRPVCGLGDASRAGAGRDRGAVSGSQAQGERERVEHGCERDGVGDAGPTDRLGDASRTRLQERERDGRVQRQEERRGQGQAAELSGGADNPWVDSVWIPCADGKARRIESGTEPLVTRLPFRLADGSTRTNASRPEILKGLGNAIVPQVAAEFVRAFMETQA